MRKETISTGGVAPPGGAYSPALRVGDVVLTSGQAPFHATTGEIVGETIEEQTRACLENVRALLEAAGASFADVVKTTVYLSDFADFERFDRVYARHFPDPKPVRTTIAAGLGGILIEIDAVAISAPSD